MRSRARVGDTWGRWEAGRVLGYRDFAGRETEVGCIQPVYVYAYEH